MRKLMLFLFCAGLAGAAQAAPLIDATASPEARDAVATLASKGLVQGYPDGVFKGDRSMSRYEVTQLVDRLQVYLDAKSTQTASQDDVHRVGKSAEALQKELKSLGGRVEMSDEQVKVLNEIEP